MSQQNARAFPIESDSVQYRCEAAPMRCASIWDANDLQAVHLRAVDALLVAWRGQGRVDLPGGAGVVRASGRLVLLPSGTREGAFPAPEEPLS